MGADPRDFRLELSALPSEQQAAASSAPVAPRKRSFLSVHFACCGAYARVYRSADGRHYRGHCPRCARPVTFRVGEGGTDCRFFVVE